MAEGKEKLFSEFPSVSTSQWEQVIEKDLTYEDLANSDEAFFTGTAVEITPVTTLDAKPIGSGKRGDITRKLQSIYSDAISGNSDKYSSWLTYVYPQASD